MPFDKCVVKKRRTRAETFGGCPPKIKKKKIKDCPADEEEKSKCNTMAVVRAMSVPRSLNEMCLQEDDKGEIKKKCPKVNLGVCKDEQAEDDDPCKRRRRGRTEICNPNLLSRYKKKKEKPKPKKTTSGMIIPPTIEITNSTHKSL